MNYWKKQTCWLDDLYCFEWNRLTEAFLEQWGQHIDWVGLSIDASNDDLHMNIGRGKKSDLSRGLSQHLELSLEVWERCATRGLDENSIPWFANKTR